MMNLERIYKMFWNVCETFRYMKKYQVISVMIGKCKIKVGFAEMSKRAKSFGMKKRENAKLSSGLCGINWENSKRFENECKTFINIRNMKKC